MLFKRATRTQPETIFMVVQNVHAGTITAGYSCVFDTGASADGVRVTQATTAAFGAYAGVADVDIAANAYGLIQVYGYRASTWVLSSAGAHDTGNTLIPVNAQWYLGPGGAPSASAKSYACLMQTIAASSSSGYVSLAKAFIHAL